MSLKLTQNQYHGLLEDKPYSLPPGSTFTATDSGQLFSYNGKGLAVEIEGATLFSTLTDTPSTLVGQGLKSVRVDAAGEALEFFTAPSPNWKVEELVATPRTIVEADNRTVFKSTGGTYETVQMDSTLSLGFEFIILFDGTPATDIIDILPNGWTISGTIGQSDAADIELGSGITIQLTSATSKKFDYLHVMVVDTAEAMLIGGHGIYTEVL